MKKLSLLALALGILMACNSDKKKEESVIETETQEIAYQSFGDKITAENVMSRDDLIEKYKKLKPGDSVHVKFTSEVKEVCQNKGCWMKMDMGEEQAMVRFKDYGFFMPKDLAGTEVIVEGYAFVDEMSVEDQRHYAEDAGKSPEEIAAITEPKRTLSFTSSGVLIPQMEPAAEKQ
jgi:hypothetical protein